MTETPQYTVIIMGDEADIEKSAHSQEEIDVIVREASEGNDLVMTLVFAGNIDKERHAMYDYPKPLAIYVGTQVMKETTH